MTLPDPIQDRRKGERRHGNIESDARRLLDRYYLYETAWKIHVDKLNAERFLAGAFPSRVSLKDKQEFIRTMIILDVAGKGISDSGDGMN